MTTHAASRRARRITPVMREAETVTPLELFFDLVFVLAFTQCTALMAAEPTFTGLAKGLLILGVLWWSWVGYAWLTSVLDPEEDAVRLVIFAAMAALLIVGLCVPEAFDDAALIFACAYAVVRIAHIALFMLASRDDPNLRSSVVYLAGSTAVATGLLVAASFADHELQGVLWGLALVLDMGGPYFFGVDGWKIVPHHFSERHALIVIIALGESIVAVGVGAEVGVDLGVVLGAIVGTAIAAALWWLYFDVVAIVARATTGRRRRWPRAERDGARLVLLPPRAHAQHAPARSRRAAVRVHPGRRRDHGSGERRDPVRRARAADRHRNPELRRIALAPASRAARDRRGVDGRLRR